jgi:hypothetical protein
MEALDTIVDFDQFRAALAGPRAFRVGGEVFPFTVPDPDLRQVVEQARSHPEARIAKGERGDRLALSLARADLDYRALPLAQAIQAPVHLSVFELGPLRAPGGALAEVIDTVYLPLTQLWRQHGLRWQKVYPILFLSGPGCATNYHWDPSSVLIVQLSGRKRFHSLRDPRRWCPEELLGRGHEAMVRPTGLSDEHVLAGELGPGQAVWSPCRAPHWLDAYDETAFTLSIAFTDISPEPHAEAQMLVL